MSGGANILLSFVVILTAVFAWQLRKESDKFLYFMMGIGVGCAMMALITIN
jgi:uncharacterized Tic20 family protein